MKYTEQQLKSALVRALPEKLTAHHDDCRCLLCSAYLPAEPRPYYVWGKDGDLVTPHEWPAIVGMVEDRLTDVEWDRYDSARHFHLSRKYGFNLAENRLHFMRVFSGQEFRAQALADIGAINVEEEK